jgi:hypothetical protein
MHELKEIASLLNLDFENALSRNAEERTVYLLATKDKIIRGQLIIWYTLIDELLAVEIARYFFGHKRSFIQMWRTKRFQNFNHYILDELSLLPKLRLVRSIRPIPKGIVSDIERINALRNSVAHSFFPENRRVRPIYKGEDIFSVKGVRRLQEDFIEIFHCLAGS